jgi:hypothetical protein
MPVSYLLQRQGRDHLRDLACWRVLSIIIKTSFQRQQEHQTINPQHSQHRHLARASKMTVTNNNDKAKDEARKKVG